MSGCNRWYKNSNLNLLRINEWLQSVQINWILFRVKSWFQIFLNTNKDRPMLFLVSIRNGNWRASNICGLWLYNWLLIVVFVSYPCPFANVVSINIKENFIWINHSDFCNIFSSISCRIGEYEDIVQSIKVLIVNSTIWLSVDETWPWYWCCIWYWEEYLSIFVHLTIDAIVFEQIVEILAFNIVQQCDLACLFINFKLSLSVSTFKWTSCYCLNDTRKCYFLDIRSKLIIINNIDIKSIINAYTIAKLLKESPVL